MKTKIVALSFLISIISGILTGCDSSNSALVYLNDMDMSAVWNDHPSPNLIASNNPHSGRFVCKLDTVSPCSPTFYKQLKTISETPVQKVTIEGWVNIKGTHCFPNFVLDIRDKNEQPLTYLAQDMKPVADDVGKWTLISFTFDLTQKNRNAPDNYMRIYAINNVSEEILLDDFKISFE